MAFCHQTLSWPAAPVYQNLRMLAARPQFSGLRVYLSFRKIIMDRDPWRFFGLAETVGSRFSERPCLKT